jgi:hypothetical protein
LAVLEDILQFIDLVWRLVLYWWWLPAFFVLSKKFDDYWRWWRTELWFGTVWKPLLLEIKIPKLLPKPIKAMEAMMVALHGAIYNDPDWWEKYQSGEPQTSYKFEIASIDGKIHFYIRCFADYREAVEAAVYSQFPEAEIEAAPDYSRAVPADIPNKDWELFGWDYKMTKDPQYPIPTYERYVEAGVEEEEIVDPFTSLMEGMAKLKPGEQLWIQISAKPIYFSDKKDGEGFVKKGERIRDILAKRIDVKKAELKPLWKELLDFIFEGAKPEAEKPQELFPAEMRLTAGEREVVEAVEKKIGKPFFSCYIRNIYVGRRAAWFTPNWRLLLNYFNHFSSPDINSIWVWSKTLTRVKLSPFPFVNALAPRRAFIKKRRLLRVYRDRLNYYSPWGGGQGDVGSQMYLNVEELATLFHFPSQIVAPTPGITRTESKETVAPGNLPI